MNRKANPNEIKSVEISQNLQTMVKENQDEDENNDDSNDDDEAECKRMYSSAGVTMMNLRIKPGKMNILKRKTTMLKKKIKQIMTLY